MSSWCAALIPALILSGQVVALVNPSTFVGFAPPLPGGFPGVSKAASLKIWWILTTFVKGNPRIHEEQCE